jgi:hypothetical protein
MTHAIFQRALLAALWITLLALAAWAYQPGLHGPPLLDDFANLRPLERIELDQQFAEDIVLGNQSGELGRPVAMASFALERLYLDRGVYGQKFVGLCIHLLNGCLVLLLCRRLLLAAGQPRPDFAALMIAAVWLTLPLWISTTLYVVQRMTLLAATFSLSALLCYCYAREALNRARPCWHWLALCVASIALATLSKENGLLCIPLIVALEVFIYGFRTASGKPDRKLAWTHAVLIVVPLLGFLAIVVGVPERLLGGYQNRPFDLSERLLTQSRILFDYVSQIVWVDVHRLGVYHDDYAISRSLLAPLSTAFAVMAWLGVIAAVIISALRQRLRLIAFGVAFFLIGHAMESTFIALELYFEHRNYLPAVGLLFALVAGVNQLETRWPALAGWLGLAVVVLVTRNLLLLNSQAVVWSNDRLLHMEAVNYHPRSERALFSLAQSYASDGFLDVALVLAQRANQVVGRDEAAGAVVDGVYHCLAGRPLDPVRFETEALTARDVKDLHLGDQVQYLVRLMLERRCDKQSAELFAEVMNRWLLEGGEQLGTRQIYGSMLLLENELERYESALVYAELLTGKNPNSVMGLQFMLYLSYVLDLPDKREFAMQRLLKLRDSGALSRQQQANLEMFL